MVLFREKVTHLDGGGQIAICAFVTCYVIGNTFHSSQNIYVSNPARGGGLHNYGLAVDVSIADEKGNPLPMGTKVDHLGKEAHIDTEAAMVQQGVITAQERRNRLLLRRVMTDVGYKPLRSEWWHFNFRSREEAKRNYKVIR